MSEMQDGRFDGFNDEDFCVFVALSIWLGFTSATQTIKSMSVDFSSDCTVNGERKTSEEWFRFKRIS